MQAVKSTLTNDRRDATNHETSPLTACSPSEHRDVLSQMIHEPLLRNLLGLDAERQPVEGQPSANKNHPHLPIATV